METALTHETALRMGVFLGVLATMLAFELAAPFRRAEVPHLLRWTNNLALVVIDGVLVRLVLPVLAVGAASAAASGGFGLFNVTGLPGWVSVPLSFLILDLAIWAQHRVFHTVPLLWRLHRMHHADTEVDATTGVRFHPGEVLLSMAIKIAVVVALGAPPIAVLAFELVLNATSVFNHANVSLPSRADNFLRWLIVTPGMHRIHHSIHSDETDSNFGFNLTWWDRMFGTYRDAPRDGQTDMTLGLGAFRDQREAWLDRLLLQPFRNPVPGNRPAPRPR